MSGARAGRLSLQLKSTMESVSEVEAAAERLAAEAGLDEDERFHIAMAAREAAVNAVLHGNEYDPGYPSRPPGPGKPVARHRPRHLPHPIVHG